MKNIFGKGLVALMITTLFLACKKEDSCSVSFPLNGAFVQDYNQSVTVTFTTDNVASVSVSATNAWKAEADLATHTLTVTSPESEDTENAARTSSVTITAASPGGAVSSAVLYVYIVPPTVDLGADGTSNCYIITSPDTKYKFNACVKGESDTAIATASVGIVWQSATASVQYLTLNSDGYAEFFIGHSTDDETAVRNGNALIAAYDDKGDVVWSWHLWISADDPRTEGIATYSNGATAMNRNLGAFGNSEGSSDHNDILDSYGLYYQWGRKDPFPRPRYYNCANNIDQILYNANGNYVYTTIEETDAEKGTVAYTTAHPSVFLTAAEGNEGDWHYGSRNNSLWGDANGSGSAKSLYDPCPKGWEVPAASDFINFELAEADDTMELDEAKLAYGWFLTDTQTQSRHFYTGGGYRSYFDGIISNVNYRDPESQYPYTPMPWVGYYWTQGTNGANGVAMFFDLNTSRATINAFEPQTPQYRANAMQVRCVKTQR